MPLAFDSVTHGQVVFGFFNIDSDMLLLEHYFFFATSFCEWINEISDTKEAEYLECTWNVYGIKKRDQIGDLMGAIHGTRFTGFIGEVYKKYPFPALQEHFKQKPEGHTTQSVMETIIRNYADPQNISFTAGKDSEIIKIGKISFTVKTFHELIRYVWRGGLPRWRNEERPDYVKTMKTRIENGQHWLFNGISWEV